MTKLNETAQCVSLLLRVLAQTDGDAVVLHAGDQPYLVGPAGTRFLAHDALTASAMRGLVRHLLPEAERDALAGLGATRYELPQWADLPDEWFEIDAHLAEGGPVVELRRLRMEDEDYVPAEIFPPAFATLRTPDEDSLSLEAA